MPAVFKSDLHKYVNKNDVRMLRKYQGKAIYLPDHLGAGYMTKYGDVEIQGDGLFDTISNFFKPANSFVGFMKDNKGSIGDVLGLAAKAVKPIISTAVGVEQIKALQEQRKLMEEQRKQVTPESRESGSGISLRTPTTKGTKDTEVIDRIVNGNGFKLLN